MVQVSPDNWRYVSVNCSFVDSANLSEQHLHKSAELGEALMDMGMQSEKPPQVQHCYS